MSDYAVSKMVDGLTVVRAVERAGTFKPKSTALPSVECPSVPTSIPVKQGLDDEHRSLRIGHTVLPTKNDIICYECGYAFVIQGVVVNTKCPKCHKDLKKVDYVIDKEWTETIRTIGSVHITGSGIAKDCDIVARHLIIEGNVDGAIIDATSILELGPGAVLDLDAIRIRNLVIRSGARLSFRKKVLCKGIEVSGELRASIYADELIYVKKGGILRGSVHGSRLKVEDGASLSAKMFVISDKKTL